MRYSEIDLQCTDVIWFGVDLSENILVFTSAGCGCVPEFVCRSQEETDSLEKYFSDLPRNKTAQLEETTDENAKTEALAWAQRGIYCYDVAFDDGYADSYIKTAQPEQPLKQHDLPDHIVAILKDHIVNVDASTTNRIIVKHAY